MCKLTMEVPSGVLLRLFDVQGGRDVGQHSTRFGIASTIVDRFLQGHIAQEGLKCKTEDGVRQPRGYYSGCAHCRQTGIGWKRGAAGAGRQWDWAAVGGGAPDGARQRRCWLGQSSTTWAPKNGRGIRTDSPSRAGNSW